MAFDTAAKNRRFEIVAEENLENGVVTLQPLAMRIPNSHGVYSPSKLRPKKEVSYEEFVSRYADQPRKICVYFFNEAPAPGTLIQKSELVTAYGIGLDCWYILEEE